MIDWNQGRWYVAGHRGLAGSALLDQLRQKGVSKENLLLYTRSELDLKDKAKVRRTFEKESPDYVIVAAAVVGGIDANRKFPVQFLKDNLEIQNNVIGAAHETGVKKLLFLGSSCIYPKNCPQPMKPEYLLSGALEPTNEWYAIAKIAGIKLCQAYATQYGSNFISVMPTNLYGPGDNYHLDNSHVLPALIRKFHEAKEKGMESVTCWGDGSPKREFLHSSDFASACLFAMENYTEKEILNIGSSQEVTIKQLAETISSIVGFSGSIVWDTSMPNGTPRKLMDSSVLRDMGWLPKYSLEEGIKQTYQDFLEGFNERSVS